MFAEYSMIYEGRTNNGTVPNCEWEIREFVADRDEIVWDITEIDGSFFHWKLFISAYLQYFE